MVLHCELSLSARNPQKLGNEAKDVTAERQHWSSSKVGPLAPRARRQGSRFIAERSVGFSLVKSRAARLPGGGSEGAQGHMLRSWEERGDSPAVGTVLDAAGHVCTVPSQEVNPHPVLGFKRPCSSP
ncbi:hypothetical protein AAFF_G00058910 [Aldrovandia affinis]|uniref:Uncharacterized protein n=1 Tax=Aldrovandia affinis TaxID=143900 RepID=A0AAD7WE42_9TELE|nr:hypothetical protein AAFF_G00058910 [Aldrovandia affinis]